MTAGPPDPYAPIEPPPTGWEFPPATAADHDGIVGVGADLAPGTILHAYRQGLFPMPVGRGGRLGWWSPEPAWRPAPRRRAGEPVVAPLAAPVTRCGSTPPSTRWCGPAPTRLDPEGGSTPRSSPPTDGCTSCAGSTASRRGRPRARSRAGCTASPSAGLFAGESMFHTRTDASKVALVGLVERLAAAGVRLLDVQWLTPHLASLGAVAIPRRDLPRASAPRHSPCRHDRGGCLARRAERHPLPQTVRSPPDPADITTLCSESAGGATPSARPTMGRWQLAGPIARG